MKMNNIAYTPQEAARIIGISYWSILKFIKEKKIPCSRVGHKILIRKDVLENMLLEAEKVEQQRDKAKEKTIKQKKVKNS